MDTFTHVGEVISYLRKKKGLSQEAASQGACSRKQLIRIEKGEQYPTSYVLNGLCNSLGIDIYEEYALILRHGGFERHDMITEFNDCFSKETVIDLPQLIKKCEQQFNEIDGELYQYLYYAKSICSNDLDKNPSLGQAYALQGILSRHPNYDLASPLTTYNLSNIDINLIYYYIHSLCKQENTPTSIRAYMNLYNYLKNLLDTNHYIIQKKYHFELMMITAVVIDTVIYNQTEITHSELYNIVCDTIDIKKKYNYSDGLANLLFEKSYLCRKLGYTEEYEKTLSTAMAIGEFYLGKEKTEKMKQWVLAKE